jgi:hypothetical protein
LILPPQPYAKKNFKIKPPSTLQRFRRKRCESRGRGCKHFWRAGGPTRRPSPSSPQRDPQPHPPTVFLVHRCWAGQRSTRRRARVGGGMDLVGDKHGPPRDPTKGGNRRVRGRRKLRRLDLFALLPRLRQLKKCRPGARRVASLIWNSPRDADQHKPVCTSYWNKPSLYFSWF